jgi:hypothetical protein
LRTSSLAKLMDSPLAARAKSVHRSGYKPRLPDNGIVDAPRLAREKSWATSSIKFPANSSGVGMTGDCRPESVAEAALPRLMVRCVTRL